jgi:hypothetical protein
VSTVDDGVLGAGAFIIAVFAAVVTVGLVMAVAMNLLAERSDDRMLAPRPRLARRRAPGGDRGAVTCSSCGRAMVRSDRIWLCERCDRASVVR